MKRSGFTMIELIFVIVILGILAAVAIPKLAQTAADAKITKAEAFVGTLNRSVAPAMWSKSLRDGGATAGEISTMTLAEYTDVPNGVTIDLTACDNVTPANVATFTPEFLPDITEVILCRDGNGTSAPIFGFAYDSTTHDMNGSVQVNK